MLQDCAVTLAFDCSTNWHGMVKQHFGWITWCAWLSEHLTVPCIFLPWWLLGMLFSILLF
jgi:hypothetical protein